MSNNVRPRRIILDLAVTLDGFIEGKNGEVDWCIMDSDEFRLSVHPVILGEGKPLFIDIKQRLNLKMVSTRTFSSGVVQLIYHLNGINNIAHSKDKIQ
jgi:dihydrofolate reductase